jgi:pimeloyl-ACP methyl ester carboxylesterase
LVCVHGFPTASVDFFALTRELSAEFDIFLLDFPGYGLSDKPAAPYEYSLYDDARLLIHAITEVWKLKRYTMLTHDRGTSVGMIALQLLSRSEQQVSPADVVLTNANIYLPLSNLTAFQTALLDPATARATARATTPEMLAAGMGASTFLNERAADEKNWLDALSRNAVNTTLVWGLHDNVSPLRVANFVWQTYLKEKPGRNRYWILPTADHYLQCDAPRQLAQILRLTTRGDELPLQTLGDEPDGAVLVDQTSPGASGDGVTNARGDTL